MNYAKIIKTQSSELIEQLLKTLSGKSAFEARYDYNDDEQWSVVTMHTEENDDEISLRLYEGGRWFLYIGYYDEEDDFHELLQELAPEVTASIPKALQNAMEKVRTDEQGLRLPGEILKKR
ncbi:hypothetical protein ACWKWU_22020 [Chitinophaga lutea]